MRRAVPNPESGTRLDAFVAAQHPDLTRSLAKQLIRAGKVQVDGRPAEPAHRVRPGEVVTVLATRLAPPPDAPQAEDIPLDIRYEDDDLLVVNKPPGLVVHPAAGNWGGTLVNALLWHCPDLRDRAHEGRPGLVHRLDKGTSGVLLVAKTPPAQAALATAIKRRAIDRRYLAVVWGRFPDAEREVRGFIGRSRVNRQKMAVYADGGRTGVREAVTLFRRTLAHLQLTVVEAKLGTGRTHQVRVQLAHLGHPVVGDPEYGVRRPPTGALSPALRAAVEALDHQALHAASIRFTHPRSGEELTVTAPPPADVARIITLMEAEAA